MDLLPTALRALKRRGLLPVAFEDLTEPAPDADLPPLDRQGVDEAALDERQRAWRRDGYVVLERFVPEPIVDAYCAVRAREGEWPGPCAYLHVREIRDLCLYPPLVAELERLLGGPMGMHLNLTGWKSTERDWHQDDYLNPSFVNAHYAAAWFALEDIHPDCGVFEFVPGTHRWPTLRGERVRQLMRPRDAADPNWPRLSEALVVPAIERRLRATGAEPKRFLARKGDVLLWHGKLVHRGSRPKDPALERRAIITHYSRVDHRPDMPDVRVHEGGGRYFVPPGFVDRLS